MATQAQARKIVNIVVINYPYNTNADVAVHVKGCRGIKRDTGSGNMPVTEHWSEQTSMTQEEFIKDYNSDFIEEGGADAAFGIKFHDCVKGLMLVS